MADLPFDCQRAALAELWRLIEELRQGDEQLTTSSRQARDASIQEGEKKRQLLLAGQERELAELEAACRKEEEELLARQVAEEEAAQQELTDNRHRLETQEREGRHEIDVERDEATWLATSVLEGGQKGVEQQIKDVQRQVQAGQERIEALWAKMLPVLARVDLDREDVEPRAPVEEVSADSPDDLDPLLSRAENYLERAKQSRLLTWMSWTVTIYIGVIAFELGCIPAVWLHPRLLWVLVGAGFGFLVAAVSRTTLQALGRRRLWSLGRKFATQLAQAQNLGPRLVTKTAAWATRQLADFTSRHAAQCRKAEADHHPRIVELVKKIRAEREGVELKFQTSYQAQSRSARRTLENTRRQNEEARARCLARQQQEREEDEVRHNERLRKIEQTCAEQTRQLRQRWESAASRLLATFNELQATGANLFGAPASASPSELPFGTITVDGRQLADGLPVTKLAPFPAYPLPVPAFLPFPRLGGLLLHAFGQGRTVAIQVLQALMLRFLTTLQPGKVRFTIFDPVGLGDNFAAFMHLADHDEALVTSRIWTEEDHLEKQLSDLTVHMENVIQKYLRSQFKSIEDYNVQAGEVAEPYRVLVVANFPVNFTPEAAARLVSIVQSGASCGVYALVALDTRQPLPQDFQLADLEQHCLNLYWREPSSEPPGGPGMRNSKPVIPIAPVTQPALPVAPRFWWGDADLDRYPLEMELPPETSQIIERVQRIGALSRDASRVEVPFAFIAPPPEQIWKSDSRRGIFVPLGRAGAVRRLALDLGQGTSQHLLIAGRTGSGKSTLWHALICNLALLYPPDEVELYLIDFKKGVEFKLYAVHQIPHARVIAIESEREFGLSVLQRLDAELRQRGDLFRAEGVHDVNGYRQAHPQARCPRILLIVDEFQEFFVEDDRLAQEAALLLDRLVRQGRAFGLHVLLGSQTLGGAYSLARSTIDQMAVRIALPCSESDAQLILNKDNSAARLLSRPGEAIYNDANGAIEGNEIFQVVWLPEEERERVIDSVRLRAVRDRPDIAQRLPLVFEGNTLADLKNNPLLAGLLDKPEAPARGLEQSPLAGTSGLSSPLAGASGLGQGAGSARPASSGGFRAWLGDAIAIKDPTAAIFRAQTGHNLLMVGQNDESALAMLASSLVSLTVQDRQAQFLVLDGTAEYEPQAGYLKALAEGWPHVRLVERSGVAGELARLSEEMNHRIKGTSSDHSGRYMVINGLHRYREFRRSDDDIGGFGRRGAERTVSPLEHLQSLLRDGPAVGIHLLIWCDSLVNVMRSLDRPGLRECGQRVLFQMNAADSSHLLDSPLASRLGRNRALYMIDELGQPEKFRPYDLPSLAWLAEVKRQTARTETGNGVHASQAAGAAVVGG
jgi:hypothetical protein